MVCNEASATGAWPPRQATRHRFYPFGLREGASETRSPREIVAADGGGGGSTVISWGEQMDVVFHAADEDGRAIELFGDAAEIRMERIARGFWNRIPLRFLFNAQADSRKKTFVETEQFWLNQTVLE